MDFRLSKRIALFLGNLVFILFVSGCGGGGDGKDNMIIDHNFVYARFNKIANATVNLYELENNGSKSLIFTQKSLDLDDINEVGRFYSKLSSLKPDKFYIYEVVGGIEKDSDNDGIIDKNTSKNMGKARLITKGEWVEKYPDALNLTIASEILYLYAHKYFFKQSDLEKEISSLPAKILKEDIDGDGNITINDIFAFDPLKDISKLSRKFQKEKIDKTVLKIHNNDESYIDDIFNNVLTIYEKKKLKIENAFISSDNDFLYIILSPYYSSSDYYLEVLDIRNIFDVKTLSKIHFDEKIQDATILEENDKIFICFKNKIKELDISDKKNPLVKRELSISNQATIHSIKIFDKNRAFIGYYQKGEDAKLAVLDLNSFNIVNSLDIVSAHGGEPKKIFISPIRKTLFVVKNNSASEDIVIFDISDIDNPSLISFITVFGNTTDIKVSDNPYLLFLHISDLERDIIVIYDLTDLKNPISIGEDFVDYSGGSSFEGEIYFSKKENIMYSSKRDGIRAIDISNPNTPSLEKSLQLSDSVDKTVDKFLFSKDENTLFIFKNDYKNTLSYIEILDNVFDPLPKVLKSYLLNRNISDYVISEDETRGYFLTRACNYIGSFSTTLLLYDITDLFSIKLLGSYESDSYVCGEKVRVTEDKTRAYIYENFYAKLLTLDLSNELDPCLLNVFDTTDTSNLPYVYSEDKSRAYRVNPQTGDIEIYDITRPFAPKFLYEFKEEAKKDIKKGNIKFNIDDYMIEIVDEGLYK